MTIEEWLRSEGGIAHRQRALDAGIRPRQIRDAVRDGRVEVVRRFWLAGANAPLERREAARIGGRLACVSAARARRWWVPEHIPDELHVHMRPNGVPAPHSAVVHWSAGVVPPSRYSLIEPVENTLRHLALCLGRTDALVVWESAVRIEGLAPEALRRIPWQSQAAAECAAAVTGVTDSGIESYVLIRLRPLGLPIQPQAIVAGHRVDFLVGERLVLQIDGHEFHGSAAARARDNSLDHELALRGYTVLRFTYAQVVHDWPAVERTIIRAVAAGAHRAHGLLR